MRDSNGLSIHNVVTVSLTKNYICSARQRYTDDVITIHSKIVQTGNDQEMAVPLQKQRDRKKIKMTIKNFSSH